MEEPPLPDRPEPTPKPWTPEEAAMIERLYAAPDDDGLRRVLVDHWLEKGDPRGEFGALSFDGKAVTADRAWLGPLILAIPDGSDRPISAWIDTCLDISGSFAAGPGGTVGASGLLRA